jgi:hypothetical protein
MADETSGSFGKLGGLNTIFLLGLIAAFSYGQHAEIMANWAIRRCEPGVVVSSALYKPDNDPRSPAQFATDNFQFCQGKIAKDVINVVSTPVRYIQEKQKVIIGTVTGNLRVIGQIGDRLAAFFNQIMESVKKRFMATYSELKYKFSHLMNIVQRVIASITAIFMALIGVLVTFTTMIQFALYIISVIVGIIIALMVIFAAFIAPVSWLVFAGIAVVGIIAGAVAGAVTNSAFCIEGSARVPLANGYITKLSDIRVGDELANGYGTVTATMKFAIPSYSLFYPLVSVKGVAMSHTHMLEYEGKPIYARDHPAAVPSSSQAFLYNLNTTSRRIPVLGEDLTTLILLDYEEIGEDDYDALNEWKTFVHNEINPSLPFSDRNVENDEAGIDGSKIVFVADCGHIPLKMVEVGDEIKTISGFTRVRGVVELLADDDALMYDGMTAGTWLYSHKESYWYSASILDEVAFDNRGKQTRSNKLYHLFTEAGHFQVGNYVVRDFSEVGLSNLAKTYSMVKSRLSEKKSTEQL